jgi:uncharacterized protein (DUF488 family)
MTIFTIGFTHKTAEEFFEKLRAAGVRRLVDVRLNNRSQLAGFSKRDDLKYFAREICGIEYLHLPQFAPTQELLDAYKKKKGSWSEYELAFRHLIRSRRVEDSVSRELVDGSCLLCSEELPKNCHRRLVAEHLQHHWPDLDIQHL